MSKRELKKQQERARSTDATEDATGRQECARRSKSARKTRAGEFMATVIGGIVVLLMMAIPPILLAGGTIALIWAIIQTVLAI